MRKTSILFTLGALLLLPVARGQADSSSGKQLRLVKVAELKTPDAVSEFQHNVHLVQAQRDGAIRLKEQIDKESDPAKKQQLQSQLDQLMKRLNENNALMIKHYGFSIDRNYTMNIDSASIYLQVSDEEAKRIEARQHAAKP